MSENVTHTGILDDCFRLMSVSDEICEAFKICAREQNDFARLGGITRKGDRFTVSLLTDFRSRWGGRTPAENLEGKLAFVLGWLTHRAADRQMKPVFRQVDPEKKQRPTECSVYHDAFVFREVFSLGEESPYSVATFDRTMGALPAAKGVSVPEVETFFRALLQRSLVELHTFVPDQDDIEGWLEKMAELQQHFYVDAERYANAIVNPEPEKVKAFIVETNFYNPEDPVIYAARRIQRGEQVTSDEVVGAMTPEADSQYGQALQMGYGYLVSASEFFDGDMDPEDLKVKLKIGQKGRDGQSV